MGFTGSRVQHPIPPPSRSRFDVRCSMFDVRFPALRPQHLALPKSDASPPLSDEWLTGPPKQPPLKNLNVFANPSFVTSILANDSKGLTGRVSRIINIVKGVDG